MPTGVGRAILIRSQAGSVSQVSANTCRIGSVVMLKEQHQLPVVCCSRSGGPVFARSFNNSLHPVSRILPAAHCARPRNNDAARRSACGVTKRPASHTCN
jgi:hypothetical protein